MAWPSAAVDKTTRPRSANVGSLQAAIDRPNCGEALGKALSLWGGWTTQGTDFHLDFRPLTLEIDPMDPSSPMTNETGQT